MKIKGLTAFVYDVEVFPNLFTCAVKNTESKNKRVYEISSRKNEMPEILKLFQNKQIFWVTYNGIHYDNALISYIMMNYNALIGKPIWEINRAIKDMSDTIISSQENTSSWRKYKYSGLINGIDLLTMMFSSKLRVGLKELQVTMEYPNVREYEGNFNKNAPESDFESIISYNFNDVDSTEELLYRLEKDIKLRLDIEAEYGVNVLSMDGVSIGKEILKVKYLQDTGKTWSEIRDLGSPCEYIPLKDVILPKITYETKQLQDLLTRMKDLVLHPGYESWSETFDFFGTIINMSEGGIHSVNKPEIIIPKDDEVLIDWDVSSLYPSLLISYEFYPKHLGKEFLNTYSNIRKERLEAKHSGNKVKNETLKLCLNAVSGLMQNEHSWMYSPLEIYKIRINGQLLLLKLAETLILATKCKIVQYNTDGIVVLLKRNQLNSANKVIKHFEEFSLLSLEGEEFEAFYQYAINDYIAVHKGYSETKDPKLIKTKGLFINKVSLGKGMAPQIIAESLVQYFVNNIPIDNTLYSCNDIKKFLTYQKVKKEFSVEYNGQLLPRINRYYMSTNGCKLRRCVVDSATGKRTNYADLCATSGVTIFNELKDLNPKDAHINYGWYKNEIYKIIYALEDSLNPTLF